MIVVIPIADGELSHHFGRSQAFRFYTLNENKNIVKKEDRTPPPHEHGVYPKWIAAEGADLVIAGGMGAHSQELMRSLEVELVLGALGSDPDLILEQWINKELKTGEHSCTH